MTDKQQELYDTWSKMDIYKAFLDVTKEKELWKRLYENTQKDQAIARFREKNNKK